MQHHVDAVFSVNWVDALHGLFGKASRTLHSVHLACGAVAPADEMVNQNEVLTVASVSADGLTVTTQQAIQFNHYG